MILYHAGKETVQFPEIRISKFTKDFSWGFYCTNNLNQAVRWANRGYGEPVVNIYDFTPDSSLSYLKFEGMTDEWLDFIAACRSGKSHRYDIVEGPMADDTVWNYVNDFIRGIISRKQFWALAEFRYPTHQISFHSLSALQCLKFTGSEVMYENRDK